MALGPRRAIYLHSDGGLSIKTVASEYKPVGEQVLVKVSFSAVNPADIKHAYVGLGDCIVGIEFVGSVIQVGHTSAFEVGQEVFGIARPVVGREDQFGGHQDYLIAEGPQFTWPVPKDLSAQDAVALPVAVSTAADALFNTLGFGFPSAGLSGHNAILESILVWGGASAVGAAAIQVAKAAGFAPIFATASPRNHDALLDAGATQVFDYNSPNVIEDIRRAVAESGKTLRVAFDGVCMGLAQLGQDPSLRSERNTPDLAKSCLSKGVEPLLASALPVPHDLSWTHAISIRPYGDSFYFGGLVKQNPDYPVRLKGFLDWFVENHTSVWKTVLKTTLAEGAERGIEEIKRVAEGGASFEKVIISHPL